MYIYITIYYIYDIYIYIWYIYIYDIYIYDYMTTWYYMTILARVAHNSLRHQKVAWVLPEWPLVLGRQDGWSMDGNDGPTMAYLQNTQGKTGEKACKRCKSGRILRKIPQEPIVEVVLWRNEHEKRVLGGVLVSLWATVTLGWVTGRLSAGPYWIHRCRLRPRDGDSVRQCQQVGD